MRNKNPNGFGIISKSVMLDKNLHIIAKALYAYLSVYADGDKKCFPTRQKMQNDLNISQDTISKYLKQLENCGYIERISERNKGKFTHNAYKITVKSSIVNFTVDEPETSNLKDYYKKNINADMKPFEEKQIEQWLNEGYAKDLIMECINIAVKNNKPTLNYVCGIIRNLSKSSIKTLDEYNRHEQQHKGETKNKFIENSSESEKSKLNGLYL